MLIVNQDRNNVIQMTSSSMFYVAPVIHCGINMGYNIFLDWSHLGTFWDRYEALLELSIIQNCNSSIYLVNAYENF